MLPTAEERLQELWSKAMAAHDPAEVESLLFLFRDALHEHIEKLRAEGQNLRTG
jgi:biotin operon repressor